MTTNTTSDPKLSAYQFSLRRLFLYVHIVAVACSAFVGIGQILIGYDREFRVLLTAVTIALASVCGLGCGAAIEAKRVRIVAFVGLGLSLIAAMLWILMIWSLWNPSFEGEKMSAVVTTFAVACSHVSLLSIARLSSRYSWAFVVAVISIFTVAILVSLAIESDFLSGPSEWLVRSIAVAAIIDALMSVLIPIFHLLSRSELRVAEEDVSISVAEIDAEIARLEKRLAELRARRVARPE